MWRGEVLQRSYGAHSAQCLAFATELAVHAKHGENASFAHNFCANGPILKILTVLESECLVPKFIKSSRYYMMYVARGSTAKKLRYKFKFWWLMPSIL